MTRLLVSVRNLQEARQARRAGVDLLDIKEPRQGSLGMANESVWRAIANELNGRIPFSVACGELATRLANQPERFPGDCSYAKIGLANTARINDWPKRWQHWQSCLPQQTQSVTVVYADYQRADTPPPQEILATTIELGSKAMLIDTHFKDRGHLFDVMPLDQIERLVSTAREDGLMTVLGGSLDRSHLASIDALEVDFIAVRGAVCDQCRTATIDDEKLFAFSESVKELNETSRSI